MLCLERAGAHVHRDSRHALPPRLLVMAGVRRGHAAGSRGRPSAVAGVTEGSPAASPARVCVCTHAARLRTRALFTAVQRLSHGHDRGARATSMSPRGIFNKTLPSRKSPNVMQMLLSTRYHTRQSHMARAARCCLPCKTAHRPATPGEEDRMRVAPVGWRRWACQRGYRLLCFAAEAHTMAVTLSCMTPYR